MTREESGYRRLLDDVIEDEDYRRFRDDLRETGLRAIRARARRRRLGLAAVAAGAVAAAVLLAVLLAGSGAGDASPADDAPRTYANTDTSDQAPGPREDTATDRAVADATPDEGAKVQIITDEELLALFGDRPCALIEIAPGRYRLWVHDPDNEFGLADIH